MTKLSSYLWSRTRIKLSSYVNVDKAISDKKKTHHYMSRAECYRGFYCMYSLLSFFSLFYNDPLGFENYFFSYLSMEAKYPFQFTFRRHVFIVDKDIRGIFSQFSSLIYDFTQRSSRKCGRYFESV